MKSHKGWNQQLVEIVLVHGRRGFEHSQIMVVRGYLKTLESSLFSSLPSPTAKNPNTLPSYLISGIQI